MSHSTLRSLLPSITTLKLTVFSVILLLQSCAALFVAGAAGTIIVANDRRTTGIFIEDENIEIKFSNRLSENNELNQASHINFVSYNGTVLLVGQAPKKNYKNKAGEIARKISSVKRVHNEIRLLAPSSLGTRSSDSYITSKIKTKMTLEKNFSSSAIKVLTENGEVFLMGLVTKQEADVAIAICTNVDGVQKVFDVFEYIP